MAFLQKNIKAAKGCVGARLHHRMMQPGLFSIHGWLEKDEPNMPMLGVISVLNTGQEFIEMLILLSVKNKMFASIQSVVYRCNLMTCLS